MRVLKHLSIHPNISSYNSFGIIKNNCRIILSRYRPQTILFSTNKKVTQNDEKHLIFEGPNIRPIRLLKVISISFFGMACAIAPVALWYMNDPAFQSSGVSTGLIVASFMASATSTLILHHFTSVYVTKLYLHKSPTISSSLTSTMVNPYTKITMETLSLFVLPKSTTLELRLLNPENSLTVTWRVKKRYLDLCRQNGIAPPSKRKFLIDWTSAKNDVELVKKMITVVNEDNRIDLT